MSIIQTWCVYNRRVFGTGKYYPVFCEKSRLDNTVSSLN